MEHGIFLRITRNASCLQRRFASGETAVARARGIQTRSASPIDCHPPGTYSASMTRLREKKESKPLLTNHVTSLRPIATMRRVVRRRLRVVPATPVCSDVKYRCCDAPALSPHVFSDPTPSPYVYRLAVHGPTATKHHGKRIPKRSETRTLKTRGRNRPIKSSQFQG